MAKDFNGSMINDCMSNMPQQWYSFKKSQFSHFAMKQAYYFSKQSMQKEVTAEKLAINLQYPSPNNCH